MSDEVQNIQDKMIVKPSDAGVIVIGTAERSRAIIDSVNRDERRRYWSKEPPRQAASILDAMEMMLERIQSLELSEDQRYEE